MRPLKGKSLLLGMGTWLLLSFPGFGGILAAAPLLSSFPSPALNLFLAGEEAGKTGKGDKAAPGEIKPPEVKKEGVPVIVPPAAEGVKEGDEKSPEKDAGGEEKGRAEFKISGFVELENFISTYKDQETEEAYKKCELRNKSKIRYGTDEFYLFTTSNIYLQSTFLGDRLGRDYQYSSEGRVYRNLRLSSHYSEASFNELYLSVDREAFRVRAGNQIFGWGTADVYNPTSYFNPYDMREFFFRDDDEFKMGIPALSVMLFLGDFTLETVFAPAHVPMAVAPSGNFWAIDSKIDRLPILLEENRGLDITPRNFGGGARLSGNIKGADMSLSAYHGPDKEPILVPQGTRILPNRPLALVIMPEYHTVTMAGMDISLKKDKFVVQAEAAYSPDKRGRVEQDTDNLRDLRFPYETRKSHYISYSTGFNYFIPMKRLIEGHEGDTVFTFEWHQSEYLDRELAEPLITRIISCRFEDGYFKGRVKVSLTGIFDTDRTGYVLWPQLTYDFQNGLTFSLSYAAIRSGETTSGSGFSENNSVFYYLRDNDIVTWRVRYAYN